MTSPLKWYLIPFAWFLMLAIVLLPGCATTREFGLVDGYEDGRRGVAKRSSAPDYLAGYKKGDAAAYYRELGYRDAQAGRTLRHPTNPDYVIGYKSGR